LNKALDQFLNNSILTAAVLSWVLAQLIKFFISMIRDRKVDFILLTKSGGMPSGHAALVTASALGIGRKIGFDSGEFALASVIAFIVMYDAAGVRQAVGIQAQILNELIHDIYHGTGIKPVKIKEILGHTPIEVLAGSFLGIVIALLF